MGKNNAIIKIDKAEEVEWSQIVDSIVDDIGEELPERVIRATELLLAGYPTHEVAKEVRTSAATVKSWINRYPPMALAIANGRKMLTKWRLAKLEQQFVKAIDKSDELLSLSFEDKEVNQKLVATIGQHARYIIGLYAGQKIDINVNLKESESILNANQDALSYIAEQINKNRDDGEPIEATYEVVPAVSDNTPLLDPDGNSPFGVVGQVDRNHEGTLCHICGSRHNSLSRHIGITHRISHKEYELIYMLDVGSLKKSEGQNDE